MGLDMYLTAKKYIGDWEHDSIAERKVYQDIAEAVGMRGFRCEGSPHLNVELCVAYWRKANAIHKWFVDNCQDGKDECQASYVSREKLTELVELCKTVLAGVAMVPGNVCVSTTYDKAGKRRNFEAGKVVADPSVAIEKLPTASGFFFGGTDYDQGYESDLRDTIEQLEAVLNNPAFQGWNFEYRASW